MKWIVITLPDFIEKESTYINQLFKAGIDLLHLRKPESNIEECKQLIQEIDEKWHNKIVVHDHFELCQEFHLHGIHLNRTSSPAYITQEQRRKEHESQTRLPICFPQSNL